MTSVTELRDEAEVKEIKVLEVEIKLLHQKKKKINNMMVHLEINSKLSNKQ